MADLLVGVGADLSELRKGLKTSKVFFKDFRDEVAGLLQSKPLLGDLTNDGRKAAARLLAGAKAVFDRDSSKLRESLARGVVNDSQFAILGTKAAETFNASLAAGIDELDAKGLLPAGLRTQLVTEFKEIGESSADQLATALRDRIAKVGDTIGDIGVGLTKGVTAPIIAIATGAVAASETLDSAYDTIRIETGKTGAALRGLQGDFEAVFSSVPNQAGQVATAVSEVSRRVGDSSVLVRGLSSEYLTLARLLKTDVGPLIEQNTQTFNAFGIEARRQAAALDFLFKTSQQAGVGLLDLSRDLQQFGAPLRQLGFNFEQSAALIATLRKEGVNTEQALAGLGRAVVTFARKTGDPIAALRVFLSQLKSAKSESAALDLGAKVFGTRGAATFVTAVREGRVAFDDFLQAVRNSPETIKKAAEETDGFGEQLQSLRNEIVRAAAPLGVELVGTFRDLQPVIVNTVRTIGGLVATFARLPDGLQTTIIGVAAMAAALGPVLIGVGSLAKILSGLPVILTAASRGLALLTGTAGLAGMASLLLPGGIILVGLALIAAAIYKSGEAARSAKRDLDTYNSALQTVGASALPALTKQLNEMRATATALKAERDAIVKVSGESTTFVDRSDLGTGTRTLKNPRIEQIDRQLELLTPRLDATQKRFNALLDAELATETGAHKVTQALGTVGKAVGDLDLNLDTEKADKALRELAERSKSVVDAFVLMRSRNEDTNKLAEAAVVLHDAIAKKLAAQTDQVGKQALAYREMLATLEKIPKVDLRAFEQKLAGQTIIDIPRARIKELTPSRDLEKIVIPVDLRLRPGAESDFTKALSRVQTANLGKEFATMSGDARKVAEAERSVAFATDGLRDSAAALALTIQRSTLTDEEKRKKLEEIRKAMDGVGAAAKTNKTDVDKFADKIDIITTSARGLLNVASAFGKIGDEAQHAVEGVLGTLDGIQQLARARADLQKRRDAGEKVSSTTSILAQLPGWVGIVGGIAQLGSSLLNSDATKANRDILKKNNDVIQGLRQDLRGYQNSIGQLVNASSALSGSAVLKQVAAFRQALGGRDVQFDSVEGLDRELRKTGTSIAELKRRAEELGISIVNSKGKITAEGLNQLNEAMLLAAEKAIRFGTTLDDQRSAIDLRQAVFDVDQTPMQRLNNELQLLSTTAPAIFAKFFGVVDTTTQQGRASVEQGLRNLVDAFLAGTIPLKDFGEILSRGQLENLIKGADSALDDFTKTTKDAAGEMINLPAGFRLSAARFAATAQEAARDLQSLVPPSTQSSPRDDLAKLIDAVMTAGANLSSVTTNADIAKLVDAITKAGAQTTVPSPDTTRQASAQQVTSLVFPNAQFVFDNLDDPEKAYQIWRTLLERKANQSGSDAQSIVVRIPR